MMKTRFAVPRLVATLATLAPCFGFAAEPPVFDVERVASIRLTFTPENWEALLDRWRDLPSDEHPYVPADFEWNGERVPNVGVRLKGNGSLHQSPGNKFPFKVDFNRYVSGQRFQDLKKINLHNNSVDPSQLRDFLSYGAWRAYGMPACRTGFADVWINDELVGLYTVVEHVDDEFIDREFGQAGGDLYKPEYPAGTLVWAGADIALYENVDLKFHATTDHAPFLAFVDTINHREVDQFHDVGDVENILTYFAGNTALGNADTYATKAHNYYLFESAPGVFSMIPWDMNLSQSGLIELFPGGRWVPGAGNGERPEWDQRPLLDRLMESDEHRRRYLTIVRDFIESVGSRVALFARIDAAVALLGDRLDPRAIDELRSEIVRRLESLSRGLDEQLEEPRFTRGDANADGDLNLSDAVFTLEWLFHAGRGPSCVASTDTNSDARVNLSDAVYSLAHLFQAGPPPGAPFPGCGAGTASDRELGCEASHASCDAARRIDGERTR